MYNILFPDNDTASCEVQELQSCFHVVSDYGVGDSRRFQILSGVFSVIGSLSLAFVFLMWDKDFLYRKEAAFWLIIRAACVIGVVAFPTDIEGEKRTKAGLIHYIFAVIQFTAIVKLVSNLTPAFAAISAESWLVPFLSLLSLAVKASIIAVVLGLAVPAVKKIFGLVERIFLFSSALYFLILSILIIEHCI